MRYLDSLTEILSDYDGFLIDLWGVVHDGTVLYDGVSASFDAIANADKRAVILSNAPRRAKRSMQTLEYLGIAPSCYHALVTSGEASFQEITRQRRGKRCYYLGPEEDADILNGLPVTFVTNAKEADFVYNIGHRYAFQPLVELKEELETLRWLNVPMVCANPDIDVIKMDGTRYPCAGEIATYYQNIGGQVQYFGKPYPMVYAMARNALELPTDARLLAIGDNLATDITGAQQQGIDSLLVTGGVLRQSAYAYGRLNRELLEAEIANSGVTPNFIVEQFGIAGR